ncbi:Glu/Leu/Phe/Val dehydrogenase dimerization domain-containing protein, partial [Pseudomonas guineae]
MSTRPETEADAPTFIESIFERLDVAEDVRQRLARAKFTAQVSIPVRMDDGSLKVFQGWRVQYDDTRGPTKGGVRFHPQVSAEEVTNLSFWMT